MSNQDFLNIKEKIENDIALSFDEYNSLLKLKEEFKATMTTLCVGGDVSQSLYMRDKMLEISCLLERAKTKNETRHFESRYKAHIDNNIFRRLANTYKRKEDIEVVHEDVLEMLNDIETQTKNLAVKHGLTMEQVRQIIMSYR